MKFSYGTRLLAARTNGNMLKCSMAKPTLKVHPFYPATERMYSPMRIRNSIVASLLLLMTITFGNAAVQASNEVLTNGGFETSNLSGWTALGSAAAVHYISHSGRFSLQLGSKADAGQVSQGFTLPTGSSGTLSFWYLGVPGDFGTTSLIVTLLGPNATILAQWHGKIDYRWHQIIFPITGQYSNQPLTLTFFGHSDVIYDSNEVCSANGMRCIYKVYSYSVYVFVDDVSVTYS